MQDITVIVLRSGECGYFGVSKKRKRFAARIMVNRKLHCLGVFDTPEEAARAYDAAAFGFGERKNLNFPVVALVEDRMNRAFAGEDIGPTSGITYGQLQKVHDAYCDVMSAEHETIKTPVVN